MYLDERSNQLLMEVFKNPMSTTNDLQKKFDLTYRQISYSFRKINSWLKESGYPEIFRDEKGHFIVTFDLSRALCDEKIKDTNQYIFKDSERANLIILMLGFHTEELSLNHLIGDLEVSKNTVLRDLKFAQKSLDEYGLSIKYSRMTGYFIDGDESNQRRALIVSLEKLIANFQGEDVIKRFLKIDHDKINSWREKIEQAENHLNYHFVDHRMQILPYILEIVFRRIEMGKVIQEEGLIGYEELKGTKEYEATRILIDDHIDIPDMECTYMTLQLLISSTLADHYLKFEAGTQLKQALEEMLIEFEKKAFIQLVKKEDLLKKLYIHMKPAYYRIKYGLHLKPDYTMLAHARQEFQNIDELVTDSLTALDVFIGTKIPEEEVAFITLFIASHLMKTEEFLQTRLKAVVVCLGGISVSSLMEQTLRNLFPEFFFYQVMSIREFEKTKVNYDIVFSSVPMETEKHFFFIHPVINEKEQSALRKRVMNSLAIESQNPHRISDVMELIAPYIEVKNEKKLKEILERHFKTDKHKGCFCTTFEPTCDHALLCPKRSNKHAQTRMN